MARVGALDQLEASYGGTSDDGVGLVTLTPPPGVEQQVAGTEVEVGVEVQGGTVSFVGADGTTRISQVPLVAPLLESGHPIYGLPSSCTVKSVEVAEAGITLELSGRDVSLTR